VDRGVVLRLAPQDALGLLERRLLDRYVVRAPIAGGGMSAVYRGEDERLSRSVCIKVFVGIERSQQIYRATYEHFVHEAGALSRLRHPNTIRIYDFGYLPEAPYSPFHVSELMDGGTLESHVLAKGPLEHSEMLGILEPIALAVAEAHAVGIIHRDIKPSNILFGSAGLERVVKLADFGVAQSVSLEDTQLDPVPEEKARKERFFLCSPSWAAPEQLKTKTITPQADIFGLGLTALFMLTGKRPYASDLIKMNVQRRDGDVHLERIVEGLGLRQTQSKALLRSVKFKPSERYNGIGDLLAGLRRTFVRPVSASPLPREESETRPAAPRLQPTLVLSDLSDPEILVAGRRVQVVCVKSDQADFGNSDTDGARIRITMLPPLEEQARVHVKGLNCFVHKPGARPSPGIELERDSDIELVSPDKRKLETVRCSFGTKKGRSRSFDLTGTTMVVPGHLAFSPLILDFGPGRSLVLMHKPAERSAE
jgi:serine/threonine-protein kinase